MKPLELVIVEDEEAHLELMKRAVRRVFSEVSIYAFGEAISCLDAIDRIEPDLIIADYLMPGMTGIEFLTELRRKNTDTPVIMITGQGDECIAVKALKLGAADYVVKTPDFFKLLPGAIEKVLREQELRDSLRESEGRFRDLAHSACDWIWETDAEGNFTYSNPAVKRILGYAPDQVVGASFESFTPKDGKKSGREEVFRLIREGRPISGFTSRVVRENGKEVFLETGGVPVFGPAGKFAGYRGIDRDVTRRTIAEQALRVSEERFRTIYEKSPIGIMLFDECGMIVDANRASLDILGMQNSSGLRGFNLFDDPSIPEGALEELCKGRTVRYGTRFDFEQARELDLLSTPKSGATHWDVQITPLMAAQQVGGYLLQVQDITIRKHAEQALEVSHRFLEAANRSASLNGLIEDFTLIAKQFTGCAVAAMRILDESSNTLCGNCEFFERRLCASESCSSAKLDRCPCIGAMRGLVVQDSPFYTRSGAFYMNCFASPRTGFPDAGKGADHGGPCNLSGYESVALVPIKLGDAILGLIHMADPKKNMLPEHVVEILERAAMELGTAIQRLRAKDELQKAHDELEMRVKERTLELASANEKLQQEIEERIRAQEALSKSTEEFKIFAYSVMHDLKSPTIGIYGLTKLLHKQYADKLEDRGKNYCDQILKASEYSSILVDQINTYIAAKESPLKIEELSLNDVLQIVMEEFSARLSIRQIHFIQPETKVQIRADRLSMLRLFRNLVDNALKYGGDELSEIRVECEDAEDRYILSVCDDGAGMKETDCERIFRPFQRNGNATGIPGTGLGLNIVREVAQKHRGDVSVEPGRENKGLVFRVSIAKSL